jgi:sugar/nucleoside kinase (ribokinase family)
VGERSLLKHNRRHGHSIWYASAVPVDYATVGHVTVDVGTDGSRRPGGSAFYSALQAARLGRRALIVTRGVRAEIERLLAPFLDELELTVIDAEQTTTLQTVRAGEQRAQRMVAWAGEIAGHDVDVDTAIMHLAPVARETPASFAASARFVGVTLQGLVRDWPPGGGRIVQRELDLAMLPRRCDAFVLSTSELESCAALLARPDHTRAGGAGRALVAVTAAAAPSKLYLADGTTLQVAVPPVARMRDDVGAGDVFAAAFFVMLAEGSSPLQAAAFANAAAAVRIGGEGPAAIGTRAAIEQRAGLAA